MTANEDQTDSEVQDINNPATFQMHYTNLVAQYYRLRKSVEADFKRILLHLREARESSRSESLDTINGVISYIEAVLPELEKLRLHMDSQMGEVSKYIDKEEGTVDEMFNSSPRLF